MTGGRGQYSGSSAGGQTWGQAHLALDAIVAFVDEELSSGARRRALSHLAHCGECAAEVIAQTQARLALRSSTGPSLPSSLLHTLRNIPSETELPAAPAGLAMSADGQLVSVLRHPPARRRAAQRRARLGAGALVTGLAAFGALAVTGAEPAELGPERNAPVLDARLQFGGESLDDSGQPVSISSQRMPVAPRSRPAAYVPAIVFDR